MAPKTLLALYSSAEEVIGQALKRKGSIKSLCFSNNFSNKRQLYALVTETLKYYDVLKKTLDGFKFPLTEISDTLKYVFSYEILFGRGIPRNSPLYGSLQDCTDKLFEALRDVQERYPELLEKRKERDILPKYVRVNVLKSALQDVIDVFVKQGFQEVSNKCVNELTPSEFMLDTDIPNVLVFHGKTDFHKMSLYTDGKIIIQDKASCLPAFVLSPPSGSTVIDACAAPGNKSSHLAAIMQNKGTVHSFDLDKSRLKILQRLVNKCGATCVSSKHQDFLKVGHSSAIGSSVDYILLDPSCSGSGIVSRMDDLVDDALPDNNQQTSADRLKRLSGFQTAALSHALSFPNVKKVVYSTCSIHKEENEDVVEKACKRFKDAFELVNIIPTWKNRGIGEWEGAYKCVRAIPDSDYTNGFFVALFQRLHPIVDISEKTQNDQLLCTKTAPKIANEKKRKRTKENVIVAVVDTQQQTVTDKFRCKVGKKKRKTKNTSRPVTS